jgi:hypothetical protein
VVVVYSSTALKYYKIFSLVIFLESKNRNLVLICWLVAHTTFCWHHKYGWLSNICQSWNDWCFSLSLFCLTIGYLSLFCLIIGYQGRGGMIDNFNVTIKEHHTTCINLLYSLFVSSFITVIRLLHPSCWVYIQWGLFFLTIFGITIHLYRDVKSGIDLCHRDISLKRMVAKDPAR